MSTSPRCALSPSSRSRATSSRASAWLSPAAADRPREAARPRRMRRMAAGPHRHHAIMLAEPRHEARVDERGLADARRAEHGEQRCAHEPVCERLDLALAADEVIGVLGAVRREAWIRRAIVVGIVRRCRCPRSTALRGRAGRLVVALEPPRCSDQARGAAAAAPQQEQLRLACGSGATARTARAAATMRPPASSSATSPTGSGSPHTSTRSRSRRRWPCPASRAPSSRRARAGTRAAARARERLGDRGDIGGEGGGGAAAARLGAGGSASASRTVAGGEHGGERGQRGRERRTPRARARATPRRDRRGEVARALAQRDQHRGLVRGGGAHLARRARPRERGVEAGSAGARRRPRRGGIAASRRERRRSGVGLAVGAGRPR